MKLKGEIDPEIAIDLSNKATLAFLQRHLGKKNEQSHNPPRSVTRVMWWSRSACSVLKMTSKTLLDVAGLDMNFNQWDPLIDGEDENLIKGTNVTVLQSAIWTATVPRAPRKTTGITVSWAICTGVGAKVSKSSQASLAFFKITRQEACQNEKLISGNADGALSGALFVSWGLNVTEKQPRIYEIFTIRSNFLEKSLIFIKPLENMLFRQILHVSLGIWFPSRDGLLYDCCVIMWWGL